MAFLENNVEGVNDIPIFSRNDIDLRYWVVYNEDSNLKSGGFIL